MDTLEKALHLAGLGFYIFPCKSRSKEPAIKAFPELATRDAVKIRNWWNDKLLTSKGPLNFGIYTGKFGEPNSGEGLVVVDVDVKNGKCGEQTILNLELEGKSLPVTFMQSTPSGGKHYVYRIPRSTGAKSGTNVFGPGVDIRANGGYVVGSGSTLPNGVYEHCGSSVLGAPDWIVSWPFRKESESPDSVSMGVGGINRESAVARARFHLEFECDPAIQGQGGDETTYKTACRVKDFGVSEKDCYDLMLECWNDRCTPPWTRSELRAKVKNAYSYGEKPVGANSPEVQFAEVKAAKKGEDGGDSYLSDINKNHALVFMGGSHSILFETQDEKKREITEFMNEGTFKRKFSTKTVSFGKRTTTWANAWLDWPGRREYKGIVFAPGRRVEEGFYNTWKGFSCVPVKYEDASPSARNGFELFKKFALDVVCRGDDRLFSWLFSYCAHMIQRPFERPLTTLVFQGKKGTGKNEFINRIGGLLGPRHFLTAQHIRYLTSNFNGHLDSCLCLVLDEAFWSGDKAAEAQLKGLTTAPEIIIERKGEEPYLVDNLARIVVIGNEKWLVPATEDERRYAVFKFGDERRGDTLFFKELRYLMEEAGGKQVLLHYLKHFDISRINLGFAPKTTGLLEQKLASNDLLSRWWFDCLVEMKILGDDFEHEWPRELLRERLREAFKKYAKEHNARGWVMDEYSFGKRIRKLSPSLGSIVRRIDGIRRYCYKFENIKICRKEWEEHMGQRIAWELASDQEGGDERNG